MRCPLTALLIGLSLPCAAQQASPAASVPPPQIEASGNTVPQRGGEPKVVRTVSEDEAVRIEELRVRGQTQRIVVRSKLPGAPAYQIGTSTDGRDAAQDRRSEGRSLWQVLAF
jgi:hypothetical protein